jgi:putative NADH-flavin reductase
MNASTSHYKILVIGANGGVGAEVVKLALQQGHEVTAIVRNPDRLKIRHDHLTIVKGDILQPETIRKSFEGKDIVVSAIGSNSRKATTLYSEGNRNVLNAMKETGVKRAFFISASGIEVNPSFNFVLQWATKNILQRLFKEMYKDLERMEAVIHNSDLNWTIVRPPRLTNAGTSGNYRISINRYLDQGKSISRADLAYFILANMHNDSIYKSTVEVAY